MSEFSKRLRELRKQSNLTQEELANKLKIKRSAVGNYEQGTREPDHETLESIADFFNVDLDYLIGRKDWITSIKSPDAIVYDEETHTWEIGYPDYVLELKNLDLSQSNIESLLTYAKYLKSQEGK